MPRIPVRLKADSGWKITWLGQEKWVETDGGNRLDVYRHGMTGRDSPLHDHDWVIRTRRGLQSGKVDRSALRADPEMRAMALEALAEQGRLNALGSRLRAQAQVSGGVKGVQLLRSVSAIETRNARVSSQLQSITHRGVKWDRAHDAVRSAESAARTARALTEKATHLERVAAEKAAGAARIAAEHQARAARIQAEMAVKSARTQAELASRTSREAAETAARATRATAEAGARGTRSAAEATLRSLRATAEAATKAARTAAEAATQAARAAAEATARAAVATGKAVGAAAAAVAAAFLSGG